MRTLEEIKRIIAEHKEEIRQKYGIVILGVFGSYARGEQKKLHFGKKIKGDIVYVL